MLHKTLALSRLLSSATKMIKFSKGELTKKGTVNQTFYVVCAAKYVQPLHFNQSYPPRKQGHGTALTRSWHSVMQKQWCHFGHCEVSHLASSCVSRRAWVSLQSCAVSSSPCRNVGYPMYFIATETITRECVSGMPNPLLFSGLFIQHKYLGALKSMQSSSDCTQQTQANVNVTWYCKLSIYSPCPAQICASATAAHIQTVPVCVPSLWKTWKHPFLYFCLWTNSTSTMS